MAAQGPAKPANVPEESLESPAGSSNSRHAGWVAWLRSWKQVLVGELLTLLERSRGGKRNAH